MSAASSKNDADYLPGHAHLTDEVLLAASGGLTELTMFVATYEAQISNISLPLDAACEVIEPRHPIVAINSNFGHKCLDGYERYLKLKPKKAIGTRKGQGDRTCFISALEPVIILDRPDIPTTKAYYMKCFPSKGQVQVPGTLIPDMSDGLEVIQAWVDLLNECEVGDADEKGAPKTISITRSRPNMINFKFRIKRTGPRVLIDLYSMAVYFSVLEERKIVRGKALSVKEGDEVLDKLPHGSTLVPPPFLVRETKPPIEDVKLTFKFGGVRVKIFQKGKVNILGANTFESAHLIHQYLAELITSNHDQFIRLQPKSDADRLAPAASAAAEGGGDARAALRRALQAAPPPVYRLTDAAVDALLDGTEPEPEPNAEGVSAAMAQALLEAASEFAGDEPQYDPNPYREYILKETPVADLVEDKFDPDVACDIMRDLYKEVTGSEDGFDSAFAIDSAYDAWVELCREKAGGKTDEAAVLRRLAACTAENV